MSERSLGQNKAANAAGVAVVLALIFGPATWAFVFIVRHLEARSPAISATVDRAFATAQAGQPRFFPVNVSPPSGALPTGKPLRHQVQTLVHLARGPNGPEGYIASDRYDFPGATVFAETTVSRASAMEPWSVEQLDLQVRPSFDRAYAVAKPLLTSSFATYWVLGAACSFLAIWRALHREPSFSQKLLGLIGSVIGVAPVSLDISTGTVDLRGLVGSWAISIAAVPVSQWRLLASFPVGALIVLWVLRRGAQTSATAGNAARPAP